MVNLWSEMCMEYATPYFNASQQDTIYIVGMSVKNWGLEKINKKMELLTYDIKELCDKYNLKYTTPDLICLPNVW